MNKLSNELPSDARRLLERARAGQLRAPVELRTRVRRGVAAELGTGLKASREAATSTRLGQAAVRKLGLVQLLALAGALTTLGLMVARPSPPAHERAQGAPRSSTQAAAPRAPEIAPLAESLPAMRAESPVTQAAAEHRAARTARPRGKPAYGEPLKLELALLERADAALRAHEPAQALLSLREHRRRFAAGQLRQEREGLSLIAACMLATASREQAAQYLARAPHSALRARIAEHCLGEQP